MYKMIFLKKLKKQKNTIFDNNVIFVENKKKNT